MGKITLLREAVPAAPGANYVDILQDSTDPFRIKAIDSRGLIHTLSRYNVSANYLYNGDFPLRQRVAAALTNFTGSATDRVFTADRWGHTTGNTTTPQYQQVDTNITPESGITARYYGLFKQLTNAAKICVSQSLIASDCLELRGAKVRFQVKMRKSVGADKTVNIGILQLTSAGTVDVIPATFISAFNGAGVDPTFGANLALIAPDADKLDNTAVSGNKLTCAITSTWQRFSGVFTLPTTFKNLVLVVFTNDTLAVNDDLLLTECGLYAGQDILDFGSRDYVDEVGRCQQFYCKTFALGTVPVTNAGINTGEAKGIAGKAGAVANSGVIGWRFPIRMWKTPTTVTVYNPGAANALIRNLTGAADMGATALTAQLDSSAMAIATGVAATAVGDQIGLHFSAVAEL